MRYPYCIIFDWETRFMSSHFQSWAASKGNKLELSTMCKLQQDRPSKIVKEEIIQLTRACNTKGNEWLSKISEIQLRLNSPCNALWRNNPFVTVLGFDCKLGLHTLPYLINEYQPAMEHYNAAPQALTNAKAGEAKQAKLHRSLVSQHKVGDRVL